MNEEPGDTLKGLGHSHTIKQQRKEGIQNADLKSSRGNPRIEDLSEKLI